jgi:hypothetical protein
MDGHLILPNCVQPLLSQCRGWMFDLDYIINTIYSTVASLGTDSGRPVLLHTVLQMLHPESEDCCLRIFSLIHYRQYIPVREQHSIMMMEAEHSDHLHLFHTIKIHVHTYQMAQSIGMIGRWCLVNWHDGICQRLQKKILFHTFWCICNTRNFINTNLHNSYIHSSIYKSTLFSS